LKISANHTFKDSKQYTIGKSIQWKEIIHPSYKKVQELIIGNGNQKVSFF
jgi:hypothetical protein